MQSMQCVQEMRITLCKEILPRYGYILYIADISAESRFQYWLRIYPRISQQFLAQF